MHKLKPGGVDFVISDWNMPASGTGTLLWASNRADSWATDGHKWLNLPFDSGFVFVNDAEAHRAVFSQVTSYSRSTDVVREPRDWNPEWSRRGRGFTAYAAIRALGSSGIAEMVSRCCDFATQLVDGLADLPAVEMLARPRINQGLVRFLDREGNHDAHTDRVIAAIQASGKAWFGGITWRDKRAMRISVCSWRTTREDVAIALAAVEQALKAASRSPGRQPHHHPASLRSDRSPAVGPAGGLRP